MMSPKGIALPMLYLIHHSRGSSKLASLPFWAGLLLVPPDLGSTRHQEGQRASAPWPVLQNISLMWAAHTLCHQVMTCSRKMHAEYKKATPQQDEMQGNLGEILWRGKDTFLLENHLYFLVFSFHHLQIFPFQNTAESWLSLHIPTYSLVVGISIPRRMQLLLPSSHSSTVQELTLASQRYPVQTLLMHFR